MTVNSFCANILTDNGVKIFSDTPVGAAMVVLGCLYLFTSVSIIYFIKLQEWKAQSGNDKAVKSIIFPVFVNVLWANAIVNILVGFAALTVEFHPYTGSSMVTNWLFAMIFALQHCVVEGVAILLMQKGLGTNAAIRCFKNIAIWGLFSFIVEIVIAFAENPNVGYTVDMIWNFFMLLFYLTLWLAPQKHLFRRPAVIIYAKFWTCFRIVSMIGATMLFNEQTSDIGNCVYTMGSLFPFTILEPAIMYYTLLQDSRWWQGLDISQGQRVMEAEEIRSPLQGVEVNLKSAQSLAASLDHMGVSASRFTNPIPTVRLLNFAYISLDKTKLLGSGSFSKVYLGNYRKKPVAIKLIFTMDLTLDVIRRIAAEAQILSRIKHPNIVEIIGVSVLPPSVCILLELCAFGSLTDVIGGTGSHSLSAASTFISSFLIGSTMIGKQSIKKLNISWMDRLYMLLGCAKGLHALHTYTKDLCHRDVKSFNFLVDNQLNTKISDLELGITEELLRSLSGRIVKKTRRQSKKPSQPFTDTDNTNTTSTMKRPLSVTSSTNSSGINDQAVDDGMKPCDLEGGTTGDREMYAADEFLANWAAPEVIEHGIHSQKSDIYSFGLVMWEMLSGVVPYHEIAHQDDIRALVLDGNHPEIADCFLSEEYYATYFQSYLTLMQAAWSSNPSDRPTSVVLVEGIESIYKIALYQIVKETCSVEMGLSRLPGDIDDTSVTVTGSSTVSNSNTSHSMSLLRPSSHQKSFLSSLLFSPKKSSNQQTLSEEQIQNILALLKEENNVIDQLNALEQPWVVIVPDADYTILYASELWLDGLDLYEEEQPIVGMSLKELSAFTTATATAGTTQTNQKEAVVQFFHHMKQMKVQTPEHFLLELGIQDLRDVTLQSSSYTTRDSFGLFRTSSAQPNNGNGNNGGIRHKALFSIHAFPIANKRMDSMQIPIPSNSNNNGSSVGSEREYATSPSPLTSTTSSFFPSSLRNFSLNLSSSPMNTNNSHLMANMNNNHHGGSSSMTSSNVSTHNNNNNNNHHSSSSWKEKENKERDSLRQSASSFLSVAPVAIDRSSVSAGTATTTTTAAVSPPSISIVPRHSNLTAMLAAAESVTTATAATAVTDSNSNSNNNNNVKNTNKTSGEELNDSNKEQLQINVAAVVAGTLLQSEQDHQITSIIEEQDENNSVGRLSKPGGEALSFTRSSGAAGSGSGGNDSVSSSNQSNNNNNNGSNSPFNFLSRRSNNPHHSSPLRHATATSSAVGLVALLFTRLKDLPQRSYDQDTSSNSAHLAVNTLRRILINNNNNNNNNAHNNTNTNVPSAAATAIQRNHLHTTAITNRSSLVIRHTIGGSGGSGKEEVAGKLESIV